MANTTRICSAFAMLSIQGTALLLATPVVAAVTRVDAEGHRALEACDPLLSDRPAVLDTMIELQGGGAASRDVPVPADAENLVVALEEGVNATLEWVDAGQVTARAESPVDRMGLAHLIVHPRAAGTVTLELVAKGDASVRGRVRIRVLNLRAARLDERCLDTQRKLAAADGEYAKTQAVAGAHDSGSAKTDLAQAYKKAAAAYTDVIKQWESSKAYALLGFAQHSLAAVLYLGLFDWAGAQSRAHAAATTYDQIGDEYGAARARSLEAAALMEVAQTFRSSGPGAEGARRMADSLQQSRTLLASLVAFHAGRGETLDQALAQNNIGLAYFYEGRNDEAIRSYRSALTLFTRFGAESWKKIVFQNIALADYQLGRVSDAVAQYSQVLTLVGPGDDQYVMASILHNSALTNWVAGNLDAALQQYGRALELERKIQNSREEARTLHGLGSVYASLGDLDLALDYNRQALALLPANVDARSRTATLRSIGNILRVQGHADEALRLHEEALSLASTPTTRALIQIQVGRDLDALGRSDEALAQFDAVLRDEVPGREIVRAEAREERAEHLISRGQWRAGESELRAALEVFKENESPSNAFSAWLALARSQRHRGAVTRALDSIDHALELAEEVRLQSANPELRAALLQPLRPAFDLKIALLADRYFAADPTGSRSKRDPGVAGGGSTARNPDSRERTALRALNTAEQARGRALADFESVDFTAAGIDSAVVERRKAIYRELAARHFQLEARRDAAGENDVRVRGIRDDIAALRVELDDINARLAAAPGLSRKRLKRPGEMRGEIGQFELRHRIPEQVAVIEYWLGDEGALAWVLTREGLTLIRLGSSTRMTEAALALHRALKSFGSVPALARRADGQQLGALILQPLNRLLANHRSLIFAPDGALHYVPFGALQAGNDVHSRYLVEDHDVTVAPSLKILFEAPARQSGRAAPVAGMLLVADPVYTLDDIRFATQASNRQVPPAASGLLSMQPRGLSTGASWSRLNGTAREASLISALLPASQVDRLEGFAASRDRFLQAPLGRYRLIHVASHATTDAEIPGLSALILSTFEPDGRPIDGRVLAADLMTVRLNADLVVLSACDTALGKSMAGEGLMGLRYIALARGARSVVSSLWEVPDEAAAKLMLGFYRSYLGEHRAVGAALSAAERGLLHSGAAFSDASLWSAFTATVSDFGT